MERTESETAVSESEMSVSESETAVSESGTAVSDSETGNFLFEVSLNLVCILSWNIIEYRLKKVQVFFWPQVTK